MRSPRRTARPGALTAAAATVALLLVVTGWPAPAFAAYPPLPTVRWDRQFLGNLSAPTLAPGGSGTIAFGVTDPAKLAAPIDSVVLTFAVYAFNGYPGGGNGSLPVSNAPVLSNATGSGASVTVRWATIARGATESGSIGISTSGDTPAGTFAVRTQLDFRLNATAYRLDSRGWFSAATWAAATEAKNGSATLNLTILGVSGVIPETAVLVASSEWPWAIGALVAAAFVLLGAGVWVYSRRRPGSSSGAG